MKNVASKIAAAALLAALATGAHAGTVYNTDLGALPSPGVTTTTSTGTVSTNAGSQVGESGYDKWIQNNVGGGGAVGITTEYARSGNGSIFFSTVAGSSKADLEYYFTAPLSLSDFSSASYDWYRDSSVSGQGITAPALRLLLNDNGHFASIIFEPYYQAAGNVPTDAWQTSTLDAASKVWARTNGPLTHPGSASCDTFSCFTTLADWELANPNLSVVGFSTGVGSGWQTPFQGAVDNINFTFGATTSSYNFEVAGVPEPASWALMILGFGAVGGLVRAVRRRDALA